LLFLFLGGCEFHSLYRQQDKPALKSLQAIKIERIQNRKGQWLRNRLSTLLTPQGVPPKPLYTLSISLKSQDQRIGVLRDATTSRIEKIITATYVLKDANTQHILLESKATATGAFNILKGADYSTIVSKEKAETETLEDLALQIQNQLACYFKRSSSHSPFHA